MATASEVVNLRIQPTTRDLIDSAAKAVGKNRSEFILEAASREAESVLLDQRLFTLDARAFQELQKVLDRPARMNARLRRLLKSAPPWEE